MQYISRLPGTIVGTLLCDQKGSIASSPKEWIDAELAGLVGDRHYGHTFASNGRYPYPRGTEIRNTRQFSILSQEELDLIAADMGLAALDPALIGASMIIEGIPDFSHLPPSSRLQGESGATLVVDMQNRPCTLPAREIEARHPGFGKHFKPSAALRRGITAWVEREGRLCVGDRVRLHIPDQRAWVHQPPAVV